MDFHVVEIHVEGYITGMEKIIGKILFYKQVLEFHFEPKATVGILDC